MHRLKIVLFVVLLCGVLECSTLEAQLLSRPGLRGRIVNRPATATAPATIGSEYMASGWYPYVIARPEDRQWIRDTPIEQRPNRPLHFWGNSRRRTIPGNPQGVTQSDPAVANVVPPAPVVPAPLELPAGQPTPTTGQPPIVENPAKPSIVTNPVESKSENPTQTGFLFREIKR